MSWSADDIPDQTGRIALVTGSNSGLGLEVATQLAEHGSRVLLAVRDQGRGDAAAGRLLRRAPQADVEVVPLDLADLSTVRALADDLSGRLDRLDLLINNAGLMAVDEGRTADGFETQFGVNHLGAFALTDRLLPMLTSTDDSRVVGVSSLAHRVGRIRFDDVMGERHYERWTAYAQSKLANLLFTRELHRRLTETGSSTRAVAAHPGLTNTDLGREGTGLTNRFLAPGPIVAQPVAKGALPLLRAATDPAAASGSYWGPRFLARGAPVAERPARQARDDDTARRLWELSAALTDTDAA